MESLTQVADQAASVDVSSRADGSKEYKNDQLDDVTELSNKDSEGNGRQDEGVGDVIQFRNQDEEEIEDKRLGPLALTQLFGPSSSNYTKLSISRAFFNTVQAFLTRQRAKDSSNETKDTGQKVFCQYLGLRGLNCDVGLDMASVQRAMFAANIPTHFAKGIAPNEVVCALGPVGGDIWMKNEGQDLIMFHEGFDNAALSRSQRQNLEKLDIIQHTLIGTKEDALEWMINGAYTRGQFAQQQILNAAFPPPTQDHDKHIDAALALFRDKALDAADPDRLRSIVTAWPLAQEVREFVEDQMLFLIHLVANNGIETILRRITSGDISEPNIGILSKRDRKTGVIPLPRGVLQPAVGPGNIIAEDNEPKIVELEEDGNVLDSEARRVELTAIKAVAEGQEVFQKYMQKAAHKAAQKEKKARLKANRRARLGAQKSAKKTEKDKTQKETMDICAAKQTEFVDNFEDDNKKQQEVADFELAKKLEVAEDFMLDNLDPTHRVRTCQKPKLADGADLTFAEQTTSLRKDNDTAKAIFTMVAPTQRTNKNVKVQKTDFENKQQEHTDFEVTKHLELGGQRKTAEEGEATNGESELQQHENTKPSPQTNQIAEAQWKRVTKNAKAEEKAEAQKKNLSKEADDAKLGEKFVLTKREEMAKAEEFEKKLAFIQEEARLKISNDAEADRNYKLASQKQGTIPIRIPKSKIQKKVNTPQFVEKAAQVRMNNEKVDTPVQKPLAPTGILKNDENVNTLQLAKKHLTPEIFKRPQERKRPAPLGNAFSGLHVENLASTPDRSGKKRKATPPTKATAKAANLKPALKVESTAEFPSLDGSTVPRQASAFAVPGRVLAWSKRAITGVPPISVQPAVEKASAFTVLDGSIGLIEPFANVVAGVRNFSSWSDPLARLASATSAPACIEKADDFPDFDGNITTTKFSVKDVAATRNSSFWSKTATGGIVPSALKKSVESTTELPTFEASTTPLGASDNAVTETGCALSWSTIAGPAAAQTASSSTMKTPREILGSDCGSAGTESPSNAVARAKPSDLVIFWKSKNSVRLDKMGKSIYDCSACKEKFGDFCDLLGHLKSEPNHHDLESKLMYDPNGERVVISASKPPAAHDLKSTKLFSEQLAPHNKRPLALTKAKKKAAASKAPLPGLDTGTIATEVPAEMIRCKKTVSLSSFSKTEATSARQKMVSTLNLPRLKGTVKGSHTSGASKLTFGSLEAEGQTVGTNVVHETDAKDNKTVANPDAEIFSLAATVSPDTVGTGTTMKMPTVPSEPSSLVVSKPRAEAGKMKRRDSINFIRTRTDSRAAQLGSPLGPAGLAPASPVTPSVLGDTVVSSSRTSASNEASTPVPEWRKQPPAVVSNQSKVQEQQVDAKGKDSGEPAYHFPAFQFPASLTFFGDISSDEPTGVDRSQKSEARPATPVAFKPFSSATAAIAAAKRPVFQTTTTEELAQIKLNSMCLACGEHGHFQIDCPFFIELATGLAAFSNAASIRHAVDGLAPQRVILTATAEEYAEMSVRGLCFACGHPGHAEVSCPFFQDTLPIAIHAAEKSNVQGTTAIATSSAGPHDVDVFSPLSQTPTALAEMRASSQCFTCGSRGHEEANCPHYGTTRAAIIAAVSSLEVQAPTIPHNREVVVRRKVGPPIEVAVRDTTVTAVSPLPVVRTSFSAVSDGIALENRVAVSLNKVATHAPGVGQTLNEFQIEDRSAFLERMASLIRESVPAGQPGGEMISIRIPQRNGGDNAMAMVLPERRVFKHKRSKSVGDKLDVDVSYYTQQEQEHFHCNQFLECKHTPGKQKGDVGYCTVHNGDDPAAYCEIWDADDLANGEPFVRRNSISIPHLEGNPYKIPDGSGAFVYTHKRAPAALVSRIENPASLAPVTKNIHVFCAGIGM